MSPGAPARALTIAGSDSGGGAGIQADLKTFAAHGVYGMSAVTAVTAQDTRSVHAVHPLPGPMVEAQIEAVCDDLGVDAVKVGMLASAELVEVVATTLRRRRALPIVLDPVMMAKSGDRLLDEDAEQALREELFPLATLVTPNIPEAETLLGRQLDGMEGRREAAVELAREGPAILLKGGHADGEWVIDLLAVGDEVREFRHRRVQTTSNHGTGCTLSAAIAAGLARGVTLKIAVQSALDYLNGALATAQLLGSGHGPVNHLFPAAYLERGDAE